MKNSVSRIEALEARIAPAALATISLTGLSSHDGAKIVGEAASDSAGQTVQSVGDFNGDGFDDFIIGAPGADHNGSNSGSAYLIYGVKAGLPSPLNLTNLAQAAGFRIDGQATGDALGTSVGGAGDINHDGLADIVVGATGTDVNGSASGTAYFIFGTFTKPNAVFNAGSVTGADGFRVDGESAGAVLGNSVAKAGDVNGDGIDDTIIGADGDSGKGAAYVLFGHVGSFSASKDVSLLNGFDGYKISGGSAGDIAGKSVAGAGDVNGDGFADVIVGADGFNNLAGQVSVLYGHGGPFQNRSLLVVGGSAGFQLLGTSSTDLAGFSVAGAGDLNGDGFSDFVIGAPGFDANALSNTGAAYVVYGKTTFATSVNLNTISGTSGYSLVGAAAGDQVGFSVSGAGDINGDGLPDVILGAPTVSAGSGAAYLVYGTKSGFISQNSVAVLNGTNGFSVTAEAAGDLAGRSVSSGGDVNGDGFADLLIGAPSGGVGGTAFVLYGSNGGNVVTIGKTGKTATYTDVDGDLVTIKTTKGPLVASEFLLSGLNAQGGSTLHKIDFTGHTELDFTNLTITAKAQKSPIPGGFVLHGDGLANVGDLEAPSLHFGTVSIAGDVGQFHFGLTDGKSAAKSFTVNSIGLAGLSTQAGQGEQIGGFVNGVVPTFTVKTSVHDALVVAAQIGTFKTGGSVVNSKIFVTGLAGVTVQAKSVALKSATVGGDLDHSQIWAGPSFGVNPDVSIGAITINGNLVASDLVAGVSPGADGVFGTIDDGAPNAGGAATVTSTIASIVIKGQALGTFAPGGHFGITAQKIGSLKIGTTSVLLQAKAKDQFLALGSTGDLALNEVA